MPTSNYTPLLPSPLQQGDEVAIVSPSGWIDPLWVEGLVDRLHAWGFTPVVAPSALRREGRFAGSDAERLTDLMWAITTPSIRAIWCSRGGYGAVRLLSGIDPEEIRLHPKWLIGYSDITLLHALYSRCGVVSLHAPMAKHLTQSGEDEPSRHLHQLLLGTRPSYPTAPHPLNRMGQITAPLVGGNLSVLYGLRDTPYEPNYQGAILFIEDVAEAPYHLERICYSLKLSGVLAGLAGLVVGSFSRCTEDEGLGHTIYQMIASMVAEYTYPLCFGFPTGHQPLNYPLLHGAMTTLTVEERGAILNFDQE